ncbi:MAG: hypothetical protein MMC33_001365 [Icmadophila ericetorum]|nr:hypothetical protein [Icmadophila ericetorum]
MPSVSGDLVFLADIPLYEYEKPYLVLLPPSKDAALDPSVPRQNLQWEKRTINITDIREQQEDFRIDRCGFQVLQHASKVSSLTRFQDVSREDLQAYKRETAVLLGEKLGAVHVICYDFKVIVPMSFLLYFSVLTSVPAQLRINTRVDRQTLDLRDPLLADVTVKSGPEIIRTHLAIQDLERYAKPGYRFRIVNTWRILNPVAQDSPLALCDFRSVDPEDLIPADRVIPGIVGETYYLRYNDQQHWCWLENQTPEEPFMFLMYDTHPGNNARCSLKLHMRKVKVRIMANFFLKTVRISRSLIVGAQKTHHPVKASRQDQS